MSSSFSQRGNMKRKLLVSTITIMTLVALYVGYKLYDAEHYLTTLYAAAENGDAQKQTSMGLYYYRGSPFLQDYTKAMKWWQRAANQGYAETQFNVGHMYWLGEGVPKDSIQSYMWMTLAAAQNYERAVSSIPKLEKAMTPNQITEAKRRAANWKLERQAK
jgi:TPR repeat protein